MFTRSQRRQERRRRLVLRRAIAQAKPEMIPPGKYRVRYSVRGYAGPIERTMIGRPETPWFNEATGRWTAMWITEPGDRTTPPGPIDILSYERIGE